MKLLRPALAFALLASTPAAARPLQADVGEVIAAERAFAAYAQEKGVNAAFRAYVADDAIALTPAPTPAKPLFANAPDQPGSLRWWPVYAGIAASADLGFTTGPFVAEGPHGTRHGWFFTIWRRQADRSWRWVLDHGSPTREASAYGPETAISRLPIAAAAKKQGEAQTWRQVLAVEAGLAAALAADAPRAYRKFLADDGRLMRLGPQPAIGRTTFAVAAAAGPASLQATHLGGAVSRAGDLAYTYGSAQWQQGGKPMRGNYVRLWQHRAGAWKLIIDETIPAFPPPPAKP